MKFHNTINLKGEKLKEALNQCTKQSGRILLLMVKGKDYTPHEIHDIYTKHYPAPITSIRRAMTDLTKIGLLKKLPKMKDERLGKPNHKWMKK